MDNWQRKKEKIIDERREIETGKREREREPNRKEKKGREGAGQRLEEREKAGDYK